MGGERDEGDRIILWPPYHAATYTYLPHTCMRTHTRGEERNPWRGEGVGDEEQGAGGGIVRGYRWRPSIEICPLTKTTYLPLPPPRPEKNKEALDAALSRTFNIFHVCFHNAGRRGRPPPRSLPWGGVAGGCGQGGHTTACHCRYRKLHHLPLFLVPPAASPPPATLFFSVSTTGALHCTALSTGYD